MLPVNEIFATIQGEAKYTGTPSVFVRLQGCPVGCGWCDTKHTWHRDDDQRAKEAAILAKNATPDGRWAEFHVKRIAEIVREYAIHHVVITGGEPALYDLFPLCHALREAVPAVTVQLETSLTHPLRIPTWVWVTGSPKLDMPGGLEVRRDSLARADEIKFPVGKQADVDKLRERVLPEVRHGVQVWLQPLSQSPKATALCMTACRQYGWRLSIQTHKYIGAR